MIIFNGVDLASKLLPELKEEVAVLKNKGIVPCLAVILPKSAEHNSYVSSLEKFAEKLGVLFKSFSYDEAVGVDLLRGMIAELNHDESVHGITLLLPLPKQFSLEDKKIIFNAIDGKKDIDGLGENSSHTMAVVKSAMKILEIAKADKARHKVAVVGAKGRVGSRLAGVLEKEGWNIFGYDVDSPDIEEGIKSADVVIGATGVPKLINGNGMKEGVIAVDVGAPKGDFDFESVSRKASFITPVPGGVGPLTTYYLFENLVKAVK